MRDSLFTWVKLAVAVAAVAVLAWRSSSKLRHRRLAGRLLLEMGLLSGLLWWNLLAFHFGAYIHNWDVYHYYIGAKYFPELGYSRLYECSAVADIEAGFVTSVQARPIRHLDTNLIGGTGDILLNPAQCTRHFTAER